MQILKISVRKVPQFLCNWSILGSRIFVSDSYFALFCIFSLSFLFFNKYSAERRRNLYLFASPSFLIYFLLSFSSLKLTSSTDGHIGTRKYFYLSFAFLPVIALLLSHFLPLLLHIVSDSSDITYNSATIKSFSVSYLLLSATNRLALFDSCYFVYNDANWSYELVRICKVEGGA